MKKRLWILLAVLALFIFTLSACQSGNYPFNKLSGGPDVAKDEIRSNGGTYVEYGEWSYFVNGVEQYSAENKWSKSDERIGMLVRVKTAELGKEEAKIEMVVPLLIFANTKSTFGFWIFGDTIYYSTPNSEKNASGVVQREKLDIMSVKLDGTETKRLHTFDSNSIDFMYVEKAGGGLYIVYVNTDSELHAVDTTASKDNDKTVSEKLGTYMFDRDRQEAYYTVPQVETKDDDTEVDLNYNIMYKYKAGSEPVLIKSGKKSDDAAITPWDHEIYTLVYAADGFMWYTVMNKHIDGTNDLGLWKCSSVSDSIKISNTSYASFIPYQESGETVLLVSESTGISKLTFRADGSLYEAYEHPDKTVLLDSSASSDDSAVLAYLSADKSFLFYSAHGVVYRLKISDGYQNAVQVTDPNATSAVEWMPIEFIEIASNEIWIIYNASGVETDLDAYMFRSIYDDSEEDDDDKIKTVCISKVIETEE